MKKKFCSIAIILGVFLILSISTIAYDSTEFKKNENSETTYISGVYDGKPCYWLNNMQVFLPIPENTKGLTKGIIKVKNRVITIGSYNNKENQIPCYWINTKRINLNIPESSEGYVSKVFNYHNKFYITGYYIKNNSVTLCYWNGKNRIDFPIKESYKNCLINNVYLLNKKIYATGRIFDEYNAIPCYWENNNMTKLPMREMDLEGSAYGLCEFKGKMYISGYTNKTYKSFTEPCYWENNKLKQLEIPDKNYGEATDISVYKGELYIAGSYSKPTYDTIICYWKNNERIDFSPIKNNHIYIKSMFIKNSKVYFAGMRSYGHGVLPDDFIDNETTPIPAYAPCYWENGTKIDLEKLTYKKIALATGIYVSD